MSRLSRFGLVLVSLCILLFYQGCGSGGSDDFEETPGDVAVPVITAPDSVEPGSSGHTASVPVQANVTFKWSIQGGAFTSQTTDTSVSFTAGAAGTLRLTCMATNTTGQTATGTRDIKVEEAPTDPATPIITAPDSVEPGSTGHTASVPAQADVTFEWSIQGGTFTSQTTDTSVSFTAGAAGTLRLTCVATNTTGQTATGTRDIKVEEAPAALTLAAFPGAEGMAAGATGGRAGVVYTVNTLEDTINHPQPWNGPHGDKCSLRDALVASGPRTVVFSVGGTIVISGLIQKEGLYNIHPVRGDLTVAGQTAPGGGIQVRSDGTFSSDYALLSLTGSNIVMRYMRFRPGKGQPDEGNRATGAIAGYGCSDIMIDHCSFEWDSDKAYALVNTVRQTLSWNIFAEGMATHAVGPMCMNYDQASMDQGTFEAHHNVLATYDHRLPEAMAKHVRWVNNLAFGYRYASVVPGGVFAEFVGNVYDGGTSHGMTANLQADTVHHEIRWLSDSSHYEGLPVPNGTAQFFLENNFGPNNPDGKADNFSTMLRETRIPEGSATGSANNPSDGQPVLSDTYRASTPPIPEDLNQWPITSHQLNQASDLKGILLPTAGAYQRLDAATGAWVACRDSADQKIVDYIQNPETSPGDLYNPASNDEIPFPDLSSGTPYLDNDGDGMPNEWETNHGLDPNDNSDCNLKRPGASGYTNLELYLSGLFPNGTSLP